MNADKKSKSVVKKSSLPKGYKPARDRVAGFFARKMGNTASAILRGSFVVKGGKFGDKRVFRLELEGEGECQIGDGEVVGAGAMIGIDETGYTKVLAELEAGTHVFVSYEGKGPSEKDAHVFTIGVRED